MFVEVHYAVDISRGFSSSAVAETYNRVIVVFRISLHQDSTFDIIIPSLRIEFVFFREGDRIVDVCYTDVLGGDNEFKTLFVVWYVFYQIAVEVVDKGCGHPQARFRVVQAGNGSTVAACCAWHNLHKTSGSYP